MPQKLKNGKWIVRYRSRGKHRGRRFDTKHQAMAFEAQVKHLSRHPDSYMTFLEFAIKWHEEYCQVHKSQGQWVQDARCLRVHLVPAFGETMLGDLCAQDLRDFVRDLKAQNKSPKTINSIVGLGKKILNTAVEWEILTRNPWSIVRPLKVPPTPFRYWTPADRDRFIAACGKKNMALAEIVAFACATGLRMGEVRALQVRDLDRDSNLVNVHQAWCRTTKQVVPYTKGRNIRRVPMNRTVLGLLDARQGWPSDALVFGNVWANINRKMKRIAEKTGVPVISFHDLRHTFASHLAMAGLPIHKIQVLLGHTDVRVTQRYAHLDPTFMRGVTDCLDSGDAHLCTLGAPSVSQHPAIKEKNGGDTWIRRNPSILKLVNS